MNTDLSVPLERISDPFIRASGVELSMLRLDQMHPVIGGNKFFKLRYNLEEMKKRGLKKLLTFGGAFSNHITAVAASGKENGFETIGVIRGDELDGKSNVVLERAAANGMQLHFVTREDYRKRFREEFHEELRKMFGDFYLLPEGGSNLLAVKGCSEINALVKENFDFICTPVGTGGTLAGLAVSLAPAQQALGFAVLANAAFLDDEVNKWVKEFSGKEPANCRIVHDFHFGRYGRTSKELDDFIKYFEAENKIALEHIYTGKMMFGLYELIRNGYFVRGEKVVALHTGGLFHKISGK